MSSQQDQIVIVDGYSFLFRAYHSMPPLTNPEGTPVGAVYGFTSMLMRLLKYSKPSHVVIVFDSGKKNFRHDIYPEYKANRPEPPEDLIPQFPLVRDAAKALNIKVLEIEGFEADDIIATLAKKALKNKEEVLIVSSDKDLMQLVNGHIKMYDAIRDKIIGKEEVIAKWGVEPGLILDLLSMVGDSSDNIPGLPGIGPKTAALLLNEYKSWENIYNSAAEIKQNKRRETIQSGKEVVDLARSLVKLRDDLKLDVAFDDLKSQFINPALLNAFLAKHNFKTLLARVQKDFDISRSGESTEHVEINSAPKQINIVKIHDSGKLSEFIEKISSKQKIALYFQTNFISRNEVKEPSDIYAILLSCEEEGAYIPISSYSNERQRSLLDSAGKEGIPLRHALEQIKYIFENNKIKKVIFDVKALLHILDKFGLAGSLVAYDDIMLMSYSAGGGRMTYDFDNMLKYYLDCNDELLNIGGITKSRKSLSDLKDESLKEYFTKKIHYIFELYAKVTSELIDHKEQALYQKMELPLAKVLFQMEKVGISVDAKLLSKLSKMFEEKLAGLETEVYKLAGRKFNIGSPKQLAEILFEDMNIEPPKKSKTGAHSTSVEVLEHLKVSGHTIADKLLEWRSLSKLKNTYTDVLPKQINPETGRVHTSFSQAVTSTGRLSSSDPNLQNIPIRSEMGLEIRNSFIAKKGYQIISADYSQIELRILAHIANVASLKKAFANKLDIHKATASEVFGVKIEEVTKDLRRKAKAINFGIVYGLSAFGLAKNIEISKSEAAAYIERYFAKYPEIKEYINETIAFAKKHGYVETLMGRRCYMKYINDKTFTLRSFAERAAINAPLQGSNADFIKKAMNKINDEIGFIDGINMILQVHDELLFEVRTDMVGHYKNKLVQIMESVAKLSVPIKVDVFAGDSWKKL